MNRVFVNLHANWRKILFLGIVTPVTVGMLLTWEIMGMYTDTQALATGSFTLVLFWIGLAFSLGIGTLKVNSLGFMGNQVSLSNPALRFLVGGILLFWNIMVPQYYSIPESTASLTTHLWFNVELGLGAIGLFVFMSGFLQIFINVLNVKINPGFNAGHGIPINQLPYRIFAFLKNSFNTV